MDAHSSIKFLDPYEKQDREIFFGRKKDIERFYKKIRQVSLCVLYGVSGTGKTSLIRCGLANMFDDSDWYQISVRRRSDRSIIEAIIAELNKIHPGLLSATVTDPADIVSAISRIYDENYKHVYLIFDQFEELFIFGDTDEKKIFINLIKLILTKKEKVITIILVMREEFLADLFNFQLEFTTIFNDSIRLERMTTDILKEEVIPGILNTARYDFTDIIVQKIIDNTMDNLHNINLPNIQVYLKNLFDRTKEKLRNDNGLIQLTEEDIIDHPPTVDDAIQSFSETEIEKLISENKDHFNEEEVWKMLKLLITPEGTKRSLSIDSITTEFQ